MYVQVRVYIVRVGPDPCVLLVVCLCVCVCVSSRQCVQSQDKRKPQGVHFHRQAYHSFIIATESVGILDTTEMHRSQKKRQTDARIECNTTASQIQRLEMESLTFQFGLTVFHKSFQPILLGAVLNISNAGMFCQTDYAAKTVQDVQPRARVQSVMSRDNVFGSQGRF